jgi:hypothetical protein
LRCRPREGLLLAVVFSIKKFRSYLVGTKVNVYTPLSSIS